MVSPWYNLKSQSTILYIFRRNAAETKISTLERSIKTMTVEIEELRAIKIQLEGNVSVIEQTLYTPPLTQ